MMKVLLINGSPRERGNTRAALDENGFVNVPIMSYSAKYASYFYGPLKP